MKNRLLPLFVVLASWTAHSQVGIGTTIPNASAQLEVTVKESDPNKKGILIPRVRLTSTTVYAPITGPEANSLLVFASEQVGDITPGYYYWFDHKWNRLATGDGGSGKGNDGIAGGDGAPGKDGVNVPDGTNIFIDYSTGTVYILTPGADPKDPASWVPINGKNGIDGKNGLNGGNGAPGTFFSKRKFHLY